jgi:hypothetical protein
MPMHLTPPKQITFWISVILAVVGLLIFVGTLPAFAPAFWVLFIGWALLAVALLTKGL